MKRLLLPVLSVLALLLAGCGSGSSSSTTNQSTGSGSGGGSTSSSSTGGSSTSTSAGASTGSSSGGGTTQVTMKSLAFSPASVTVKVGQTVNFTNDDTPAHNVTYVSGPKFTSSSNMNPGATFSIKATQAGTIHYYCTIHPFMKGTIVVTQ